MSNDVAGQYFSFTSPFTPDRSDRILEQIVAKTGFQTGELVFEGKLYDDTKIATRIFRGIYQNKPAMLKIQGIRLDIPEEILIEKFNAQNQSKIIRLPHLYLVEPFDIEKGYGCIIMEEVQAPKFYAKALALENDRDEFARLYEDYRTKAITTPLFEQTEGDTDTLRHIESRIEKWISISAEKGFLQDELVERVNHMQLLIHQEAPALKMVFMHGHLERNSILRIAEQEYVLLSNTFWSYRPEWYDTTFHLWEGIKGLRNVSVSPEMVWHYVTDWLRTYQSLELLQTDPDFKRKYYFMLLERCIGALLLDIELQKYETDREKYTTHLKSVFGYLFDRIVQEFALQ